MTITTNKARCRDCYRCVRTCPVKAVKVQDAQAEIIADYCIVCAGCVRACPQHAKQVRDDLSKAKDLIAGGVRVVASVAPSMAAWLPVTEFEQVRGLLLALGFADASETAIGADLVAAAYPRLLADALTARPVIATACPVVVFLVEKYYPDLIPNLAPVVSPMIAHARWLKRRQPPGTQVVFIGPCVAKKTEADDEAVTSEVAAALTFEELQRWVEEKSLIVAAPTGSPKTDGHPARLFPVEGGLLRTALLDTNVLSSETLTISGIGRCRSLLDAIRQGDVEVKMVELMACADGCINGPSMPEGDTIFARRQRIVRFARAREAIGFDVDGVELRRGFRDKFVARPVIGEEGLRLMLERTDKYTPEDELNCTACGYASCREKAEATCRGMAEVGMCVPYMRQRAESLANVVIDATPNAIVVVDSALIIQELSPRAEGMFRVHKAQAVGRPVADFLPCATFEQVRDTRKPVLGRRSQYRDDLVVAESVVPVEGSKLLIGIIEDVTAEERGQRELNRLRHATARQAQEVIDKQMRVAHEIASLLGETTAETKVQLSRLIRLMEDGEGGLGR